MSISPLLQSAKIFGAVNSLGLAVSITTGSHLHLDLLGTGCFAISALRTLGPKPHFAHLLSAGCISLWSVKLAGFLFYRALQVKHDGRLDDTLSTVPGCAGFWWASALWGVFCMLPHNLAAGQPVKQRGFGLPGLAGLGIFSLGLAIETMADYQKWEFKGQPDNRGKFCDVGLWGLSQHPNYVGNLMIWIGLVALNAHNLVDQTVSKQLSGAAVVQRNWRFGVAAWAPIFMYGLFYAQASGVLMDSVSMAQEKYGSIPGYAEYVRDTPVLLPRFFDPHRRL